MESKINELKKLTEILKVNEGLSDYGVALLEGYINSLEREISNIEETSLETNTLVATFSSSDAQEIKRLAKADDMASFIWELHHNSWREFKHTDYDYERYLNKINQLLEDYHIDIDDLTS